MTEADKYSAIETLRDGGRIQIRALTPEDGADLSEAVARTSDESLRRRFFFMKRHFTDKETAFFLNVDFVNHVALIAVVEEGSELVIAGGGRYSVGRPGEAGGAFVGVGQYQGRGAGGALMCPITTIPRAAGLEKPIAEGFGQNGPLVRL